MGILMEINNLLKNRAAVTYYMKLSTFGEFSYIIHQNLNGAWDIHKQT